MIAEVFFQSDKRSLARLHRTDRMFQPLRAKTVVLATTSIQHALSEYSTTSSKIIAKFDSNVTFGIQYNNPIQL